MSRDDEKPKREPVTCRCPEAERREEAIRSSDGTIVAYQCRACRKVIESACPFCRRFFDRPKRHIVTCYARPRAGGAT